MATAVTVFAPAKINLALHVIGRRDDGLHELDSAVAFADVGDSLQVTRTAELSLAVDGPFAEHVPVTADNLVLRAHTALAAVTAIPPVAMQLTKNLPVASGIGGGSADGAAALRALMQLFDISMHADDLRRIALTLGADVPVCLHGRACRMQGIGEVITPLIRLPAPALVLANPLKACGTADVFRGIGLKPGQQLGSVMEPDTPQTWRNDMTAAALQVLPEIGLVLNALKMLPGQSAVRMSGSGATCFAMFDDMERAEHGARLLQQSQPSWWVKAARLS